MQDVTYYQIVKKLINRNIVLSLKFYVSISQIYHWSRFISWWDLVVEVVGIWLL